MQPKLIISFDKLKESDFLAKTELISSSVATNTNFPAPWQVPGINTPTVITGAYSSYQLAYNGALSRDSAKIMTRKTTRATLTTYLKKLAPYLEGVAAGDMVKLISTGYTLRADSTHTGGGPLPAPAGFTVERGVLNGTLVARAKKLKGADGYRVQMNDADPNVAANWRDLDPVNSARKIDLAGLTAGRTYWVRICGFNGAGMGVWTSAANTMVV